MYIDKDAGVDIEECGIVSERLGEKIDELDPIQHNYFLEVSSPGAERPLKKEKDFEKAVGKQVYVKTYEPIEGEKELKVSYYKMIKILLLLRLQSKQRKEKNKKFLKVK